MTSINSVTQIPASTPAGTASETAIATTPAISVGTPLAAGVIIRGFLEFSPGTGCTTVTIRCRQGSIGGASVVPSGILSLAVVAGANICIPFCFQDTSTVPEQAGGLQYVITTTPNGTGASTALGTVTVEV